MFPWILTAGPGILFALKRKAQLTVAILICSAMGVLLYLPYNNFWASNLFKYHALHYIVWIIPLTGLGAYLTVRYAWRELHAASVIAALISPIIFVTLLHVQMEDDPHAVRPECEPVTQAIAGPDGRQSRSERYTMPLKSSSQWDGLKLTGWPSDLLACPIISIDSKTLRTPKDYLVFGYPRDTFVLFPRRMTGRTIELRVWSAYSGPLFLSDIRLQNIRVRVYPSITAFRHMRPFSWLD